MSSVIAPVPAIVAAAGLSSRMGGEPKPLMDAGGRTFLARILATLKEGGVHDNFVVVRDPAGPVAAAAEAEGALVVENPRPGTGPISSLQAGLMVLPPEAPAVLFVPADHPLFLPDTVRVLLTSFFRASAPVLVPSFQGRRGHPVLFHRDLFPELLEDDLPEGARTVVRRHARHRREVAVEDPGILVDIDTPEDYRRHFPGPGHDY